MKQAIIIRNDLKMGKGKIAAQASHASIASFLLVSKDKQERWLNEGMKKVVLKVNSEKELVDIFKKAKKEKISCELITDAGLTQLEGPTKTAVGIGPDTDEKIDMITGKLKLL